VFLIDEYGRIDSTSDSCHKVLNIDQKLIDVGLLIQQVFMNLEFEGYSSFINGQDYLVNKKELSELLT
jgi:hypothetical protein